MVAVHSDVFAVDKNMSVGDWFVDNGATCHLTFRNDIFTSFEKFSEPHTIQVANGNVAEAVGKGVVFLEATVSGKQQKIELRDVWYVPKLQRNLFSVLAAQDNTNMRTVVSLYRQGHSTETALLDVPDSVHTATDSKEVTLLIGLDLSAAFDTVCHSTLIKRLQTRVLSVWDCTILDSVISTGSDTVCEARAASVF